MRLEVMRSVANRLDSKAFLGKILTNRIAKRRKNKGKLGTMYCWSGIEWGRDISTTVKMHSKSRLTCLLTRLLRFKNNKGNKIKGKI